MLPIRKEEIYIQRGQLLEQGGFTEADLHEFTKRNNIEPNEDRLWPVTVIISALNGERKKRRWGVKGEGMDQLDLAKRGEEVRKLRIINDEREGILIERQYVKDRIRLAFQTVASKIRYAIKNTAPRIVGLDSAKIIEEVMIKNYNGAIVSLEEDCDKISIDLDGIKAKRSVLEDESSETQNKSGRAELATVA